MQVCHPERRAIGAETHQSRLAENDLARQTCGDVEAKRCNGADPGQIQDLNIVCVRAEEGRQCERGQQNSEKPFANCRHRFAHALSTERSGRIPWGRTTRKASRSVNAMASL